MEDRLRELAFLNKGLTLSLHDERTSKEEVFKADGGLAEFVKYINRMEEGIHPPIHIEKTVDQVAVEVSMQYTRGEEERNRCYTNNAFNSIGGTHLSGFRTALRAPSTITAPKKSFLRMYRRSATTSAKD